MDTTQPVTEDLTQPSPAPPPDSASLLNQLETLDPAEAPGAAEQLAEVLTEQLDATGHGAAPQPKPAAAPGSEEQAR